MSEDIGSMNLVRNWPYGSNAWKPGMDENLLKLAYMTQGSAEDRVDELPLTPTEGQVYILNSGQIAIYDLADWRMIDPPAGCWFYVASTQTYDAYIGTPLTWQTVLNLDGVVPPPVYRTLALYVPGKVVASDTLYTLPTPLPVDFPAGLAGSKAYAQSPPSGGSAIFNVKKNGTQVATITFTAGDNNGTFAAASAFGIVAGDILTIESAAALNEIANLAVSLLATTPGV